jgi:RNA polymerase sigma factor (TIGR02999 family)
VKVAVGEVLQLLHQQQLKDLNVTGRVVHSTSMADITQLLGAAAAGDRQAAADLLPLVYDELRQLAASRMANEKAGHTLQPTALVHEAYLRLVGATDVNQWQGRGHFFAAAAEAMRRILVDWARRKRAVRHGGGQAHPDVDPELIAAPETREDLVALDEALSRLAALDPEKAEVVKLRYFAGLTFQEVADVLGLSERTARRQWAFARAWLRREIEAPAESA